MLWFFELVCESLFVLALSLSQGSITVGGRLSLYSPVPGSLQSALQFKLLQHECYIASTRTCLYVQLFAVVGGVVGPQLPLEWIFGYFEEQFQFSFFGVVVVFGNKLNISGSATGFRLSVESHVTLMASY